MLHLQSLEKNVPTYRERGFIVSDALQTTQPVIYPDPPGGL